MWGRKEEMMSTVPLASQCAQVTAEAAEAEMGLGCGWVGRLPRGHKPLGSIYCNEPGVVVQACNPRNPEMEAGRPEVHPCLYGESKANLVLRLEALFQTKERAITAVQLCGLALMTPC